VAELSQLISRCFPSSDRELRFGPVSVTALASKYGTPFFVYDSSVLDKKLAILREALPSEFEISYSMKANPNGAILRHFLAKGCGLEIASAGEFYQAVRAGCPPDRMLFAGPGKTEAELEYVLMRGIGEIHLESVLEIERISSICRRLRVRANVAIRVNPSEDSQAGAMRMGGKSAPFGVDEELLDLALDRVLAEETLSFHGIHLFSGTQILDADLLLNQYRKGLDMARRVARRLGHPLHTVDFGGGLGIPYFAHEEELDMRRVREGTSELQSDIRSDRSLSGTRFVVEPGRYLVGEAGTYVARVTEIKVSRGKKYLILDGGMNHHLAASGNLGQTIKRNYPIGIVNNLGAPLHQTVEVVGPLCTPLDVLGRSVELPEMVVGDLIGVFLSGAYARAASPLGFLSHPAPPEIWIASGQDSLVRRRGEFEDYLADQNQEQIPTRESLKTY
jgi:diaminopimelate decarboxylase